MASAGIATYPLCATRSVRELISPAWTEKRNPKCLALFKSTQGWWLYATALRTLLLTPPRAPLPSLRKYVDHPLRGEGGPGERTRCAVERRLLWWEDASPMTEHEPMFASCSRHSYTLALPSIFLLVVVVVVVVSCLLACHLCVCQNAIGLLVSQTRESAFSGFKSSAAGKRTAAGQTHPSCSCLTPSSPQNRQPRLT